MIKAILFDFDGVLATQDKFYSEHYCHINGLDHTDWLAFWLNDFQDCLVGKTDCKQVMQKFLQSQALDIDIEAYFKDWFDYEYNLNTELFELIDKIRHISIKTYISSNQEQYKHEFFQNQPGLTSHFDQIFTSSSLGHKKPDSQFWLQILQILNLKPHEVLFIDDTLKYVQAAQKLGIQSHHYTNFADAQSWLKQHLDFN